MSKTSIIIAIALVVAAIFFTFAMTGHGYFALMLLAALPDWITQIQTHGAPPAIQAEV